MNFLQDEFDRRERWAELNKVLPDAAPEDFTEIAKGTPYPPEAFAFVQDAYRATERMVYGFDGRLVGQVDLHIPDDFFKKNRIDDADFCVAAVNLAIDRWGLMGQTVLSGWGIRSTLDIGRIAETLTDAGLIPASEPIPGEEMSKAERLDCYHRIFAFDFSDYFIPDRCVKINLDHQPDPAWGCFLGPNRTLTG